MLLHTLLVAVFCSFCVDRHMVISLMSYVIIQLEEDHSETQRLLAQERSARTLQENLLNSHLRKQQEIENENKRNISKSNEVILTVITSILEYICLVQSLHVYLFVPIDFDVVFSSSLMGYLKHFGTVW